MYKFQSIPFSGLGVTEIIEKGSWSQDHETERIINFMSALSVLIMVFLCFNVT